MCPDCGLEPEIGSWPWRCKGRGHRIGPAANPNIHASERVVILENPQTGEVRIPGRGDRPIHAKYAACGFVRKEIETIQGVKQLERRTGKIAEVLHYDRGSATAERDTGST